MERQEIKEFIREVLGMNAYTEDQPNWVSIRCPFAPFTHRSGRDSRPSAGISIKDNGHSIFNCYACGFKGTLPQMLDKLGYYTGEDWSELADSIENGAFLSARVPAWGERKSLLDTILTPIDPDVYLDMFDPLDPRHPYLRKRGVDAYAAEAAGALYDSADSEGVPRIVLPVYGPEGELYGFSGRAVTKDARLKVRDYYGLPKRSVLLGSHLIRKTDRYIIVVEGLIDYLRMLTHRQPVVAHMSGTLTDAQIRILRDLGKPVYYFKDNDPTGDRVSKDGYDKLHRYLPYMQVTYPEEATYYDEELGDYRPPEDPAELTLEQVCSMKASASL